MGVYNVSHTDGSLNLIASKGSQTIQYQTMPVASAGRLNQIAQYVGTTTLNYTNGYFYKCEEITTGNYGWVYIPVQDEGSGSSVINGYYNTSDGKFYEEDTYTTEIIGETEKIYISVDTNIQYRWDGTDFVTIGGSIPVASSSVLGGIKVGTDLDIDANGVLTTNLGLVVDNGKLCVRHSVDEP